MRPLGTQGDFPMTKKSLSHSASCRIAIFFLIGFGALFLGTAHAQRFGSNLRATPNAFWGCELAPIFDPITGAPTLSATGQTTCTMRNVGYINSLQIASYVPTNGRITEVRVRSGANPARLRVVIMQCSPGLCGTAIRFSRVFRPRPNRITVFNTNLRVDRTVGVGGQGIQNVIDAVAITAVGPGTLPLRDQGTAGTYSSGSALTQLWYPATQRNVPRVEGYSTVDGLELLVRWRFQRSARR